ncbi:MAG: 4-hydroxy-tetrahydrodipicolinate synthase [Bacteroidia bacterium]|nr:4-hydroxy-tetrahydrodipicolinate synthase [Bacteroidia bacterium]
MRKAPDLTGTGVAIVTPFKAKGKVDYKGLKNVLEHIIRGGVEYVVVLGTTGESATLDKEEKKEVLSFIVEKTMGRVPVVAGIGGNHTTEVIKGFSSLPLKGVSAILSVSPYYNKPNQRGIYAHYKALAGESPLPLILYNVPGRTAMNLTAETTLKIAHDFPNIIATKEASGNLEQVMSIIKHKPKNFKVISGDDNLTLPMIACGAEGVISVVANAYPNVFSEMVRQALKNNYSKARDLHYKLTDITGLLFADGSPGGVKAALEMLGICRSDVRLPLVKISDHVQRMLKKQMETIK